VAPTDKSFLFNVPRELGFLVIVLLNPIP